MDYGAYEKWLKPSRGAKLANKYIQAAQTYQTFLEINQDGMTIENATLADFRAFEATIDDIKRRRPYWYLYNLYLYLGNEKMATSILRAGAQNPVPVAIKTFRNVKLAYRKTLAANGIVTNLHLLHASRTEQDRARLAEQTGIPLADLIAIIKIADLRRMIAMSRIESLTGAGFDMLYKVAQASPEMLFEQVQAFHKAQGLTKQPKAGDYTRLPFRAGLYPILVEGL